MIGGSDDKQYESELDLHLGNPIQDDFAAINKSGNKPIEEPTKPSGNIRFPMPEDLLHKIDSIMKDQQYRGDPGKTPYNPKKVDEPIMPNTPVLDPQRGFGPGDQRDVRVSQNTDYDMEGFKRDNPDAQMGPGQHYPDTYKLPNHPTFSDESKYHGQEGAEGGHWDKNEDGTYNFTPGKTNLEHFTPQELRDYFNRVEPGNKLNLPEVKIDTSHNVKSASVASKDSNTVYIDPKIPEQFHPFLAVHEETEKHLMAGGMPYAKAHVIATIAEKHAVEASGQNWVKYTDEVDPYVAKTEKGSGKNPPPDPHVNIEDAIGHHADKASVLEHADIKIGDASAQQKIPAGKADPEVQQILDQAKFRNMLQYYMGKKVSGLSNTSDEVTPQPESEGT